MKNKNIGARVIIYEITTQISPETGWVTKKKVAGVIVEKDGHDHYYVTCDGAHGNIRKNVIEDTWEKTYAIKMADGTTDLFGSNVVVVAESRLTFLDATPKIEKIISEKQYHRAMELIAKYEQQHGKDKD